ncbi:hypothetical protein L5515_016228 [Caenorhabditis briggsae]|uniref:Potassium channel domain-containing protein n=1 Tax=Caenorhabditis briggsae TaxID=6238 RepID=A0AAE9JNB9_CAEBR|nr:hypothetical protein L5515_016228 [Caenorhabditis briggsae]
MNITEVPTVILHSPDTDSVISEDDSCYYFDGSVERLPLRNPEYSDERSMQRRNPIRRQRTVLDEEQTKDAMKLLQKYVKKKYAGSAFLNESHDEQAATPVDQSAGQFSRNQTPHERLSAMFNASPSGAFSNYMPAVSPDRDPAFRSELFKPRERESWGSWFFRVIKFLYQFLGLQYVMLALVILGYACIGGYMFQALEHDQQQLDLEMEQQVKIAESTLLAENLMDYIKKWNCGQSNEKKCLELIMKAFVERTEKVEKSIRGDGWRWDFWNSVFFSATIFTTIGYGNLTCKTNIGRIATIIYGLIGIPLMLFVLKVFGEFSIGRVKKISLFLKRCMKRCYRRALKRSNTIESVASDEMADNDSDDTEEEEGIATFPVKWALFIVFSFIVICSFIVSFWEKWDFLTAFYFFFVSLSTIGFGDVIPEHPRTACGLFILYFVGLALFSMVYAILQERVENKYMWALELIDQEYQDKLENVELDKEEQSEYGPPGAAGSGWGNAIGQLHSQNLIKWRNRQGKSMDNMPDRPISERRFSVFTPGEPPHAAPPVLGTFMFHNMSMKKKLIARSESILNQQNPKRPSTLFPSNEMLSNSANSSRGSPWPHAVDMNQPKEPIALGKSLGISAPNLANTGNRSPSGALSVITEASDEDTRHFKKHRKPLAKTMATSDTPSNPGSAESLDQEMDELQLEFPHQSITPKPYRDPHQIQTSKFRKQDETVASRAERMPLSPREPLEEEDEETEQ